MAIATKKDRWVKRWQVPSSDGSKTYTVAVDANGNYGCSCPAWKFKRIECHHIRRVKAGGEPEEQLKPLPPVVFACIWKPKYKPETNELYIPLVRIGDTHAEATICYYLLKYGYSMVQVREMRHIPRQWTAKAIRAYIEAHGEAERDPRPDIFGHPIGDPVPRET